MSSRFSSARNQYECIVDQVIKGATTSIVKMTIKHTELKITSSITNFAVDDLHLKVGDSVFAFFKACNVIVATSVSGLKYSVRNVYPIVNTEKNIVIESDNSVELELCINEEHNLSMVASITKKSWNMIQENKCQLECLVKSSHVMIAKQF